MPIDQLQVGASTIPAPSKGSKPSASAAVELPGTQGKELPEGGNTVPPEASSAAPKPQQLDDAVSSINEFVQNLSRSLQFSVDEASGRTIVKVTDSETGDLIRQIPSDEILAISKAIAESMGEADGFLLRDRV